MAAADLTRPLADRMRPENLGEFVGQVQVVGPGKPLRAVVQSGQLHSLILWGPPGTGKTTLARLIARASGAEFIALSAVMAGVKDVRAAVEKAQATRLAGGGRTVLFLDEVHRFSKSQQDTFLPYLEDGTLIFIGATTENPSFEVVSALLSRARVYVLKSLSAEDLRTLLQRALGMSAVASAPFDCRSSSRRSICWWLRPMAMRGARSVCSRSPLISLKTGVSRRRRLLRSQVAADDASIKAASSSMIRSLRYTKVFAALIPMPRCTGSAA